MKGTGRLAIVGLSAAVLAFGTPGTALADPEPSLSELSAKVEKLHEEIETLTEQYNGERVKLTEAKKVADRARRTLAASQSEFDARREKATLLAQKAYMTGGLTAGLALNAGADAASFLDRAATTYAVERQQGQEVVKVAEARAAAERARETARTRAGQVGRIVEQIRTKRDKIRALVKRAESRLFRRAMESTGQAGSRSKIALPIPGDGKAAEAARWALTQQLKPYIWGAEGPTGFDCSGLVMWAYQKVGIRLPHYTGAQWKAGTRVAREDLRPGDLVFFYSDLHHVGIYVGGGMMIHAPRTGDVVHIASIANRPYAGAVRVAG